jgi:hypothetical protein
MRFEAEIGVSETATSEMVIHATVNADNMARFKSTWAGLPQQFSPAWADFD